MFVSITSALVGAIILSIVLRILMISLRQNIALNEDYILYLELHREDSINLNDIPDAYCFTDYDFIKDFKVNRVIIRDAIWSREYFILLFINAVGLLSILIKINNPINILSATVVMETLILLSMVDIRYGLIPDSSHIIILVAALLMMFAPESTNLNNRLLGLLIGGGFFWILNLLGGMGGGDVKLMAVAGFWMGYPRIMIAMIVGIFCAAIVGVLLIITKKKTRKDPIAFGPYLSFGIIIAAIFYADIIELFM